MNSKYIDICTYVKKYIRDHGFKDGDKLPTEKEMCDELSISRTTIRRALQELQEQQVIYKIQGSGTYVGIKPAEKISGTPIVPMVLSRASDVSRFIEFVQGAESYLSGQSYFLSLHVANESPEEERHIISRLVEQDFRYILVSPFTSEVNTDFYFSLSQQGIHFIFIDILPNGLNGSLVTSDNVMGGYLATEHLISQGYKRIAFFSSKAITESTISDRETGYDMAMRAAGQPIDPALKIFFDYTRSAATPIAEAMQLPQRPDAFFAVNDVTAAYLFNQLERLGYRIPEDVGIIGFDNLKMAFENRVSLSSIHQDFYKLGYEAAKMCLQQMATERPLVQKVYVPVQLVERESTQRLRYQAV